MDNKNLNVERLKLIRKGYVNKSELGIFLDIGKSRANTVYDKIVKEIAKEDKTVDCLGIRVCRVLEYIGLTENDIRRFADDELKAVN